MLTHLHINTQNHTAQKSCCERLVGGPGCGCPLILLHRLFTVVCSVRRGHTVVFSPDSLFTQLLTKRGK